MPITVPEELSDAHSGSCDSSLPPSTPSTSPLDSRSHIARATSRTLKHERRSSLGLIDAARVRISQDFRAFLCSTSKLQRIESIASVETEETEHPKFVYPDYARNLRLQQVDVDVEPMELSPQHEERQGRTLGARIVNFLNRSRSRSRKRRSRSLDVAIAHDPMPIEGPTSSKHKRHSSLDPDGGYAAAASSSASRPVTRSPSRPLSPTTKPKRSQKALGVHSSGGQTTGPMDIRTEVVILEQTSPDSSRKGKKMNFFGLTLSSPRMSSFGDSSKSKSRPTTPGSQPNSRKGRGVVLRPGSAGAITSDAPKRAMRGDILIDHNRPASPPVQSAPARCMTASPRHNGHYEEVQDDVDSEALAGRCSPLCGLGPSTAARSKGKERERLEDWEQFDEKEVRHRLGRTESETGKGRITNPRRVHSPTRELEKGSRPLGALSMERVASGSGTSRGSRGRDGSTNVVHGGAQANVKAKRIKHGSFDFESPVPAGQGRPLPSASLGGRVIAPPHPLQRGSSSRGPPRRVTLDDTRPDRHVPLSSSLPKARPKPALDINTHNLDLTRRTTGSSTATSRGQTSAIPRSSNPKAHHGSETDPGSPISSTHSGNSSALNSSWGKSAGKRMARGAHPAFKFEPAVPTIPGSPAGSEERKRSIATSGTTTPTPSSPLSRSRQARNAGKGRSLDLNLGLSWAPTKVREDVLSRTVGGRVTPDLAARAGARWRATPADEGGRLGAGSSGAEVAETFREVLGDAAYSTFKTYVHRYDARAIPLDGPFGLMHHVQRLLDSAPGLDLRRKQALLGKLSRVVQEIR